MPRVLYIDDDKSNRMLVRRILMAADFDVEEAESAALGIQMALANPPDVILMDMSMPEMDGLTAIGRIRSMDELKDILIIMVTANVMEGDRERSLKAGSDGYIGKPIDVDLFPKQINEYITSKSSSTTQ